MNNSLRWRVVLAVLVLGLGLVYALPSFLSPGNVLHGFLPDKEVNLGLDLKGGLNLTLGVDMDKAMSNTLDQLGEELRSEAREKNILILRPRAVQENSLQFLLLDGQKSEELNDLIEKYYSEQASISQVKDLDGGEKKQYVLSLTPEYIKKVKKQTIDQVLKVIRNRIDQFGVTEPDIRRLQQDRLQVQLPGMENAQRAVQLIQKTALLEFKLVDDDLDPQEAVSGSVPPGRELAYLQKRRADGTYAKQPIVLEEKVLMTGKYITDAQVAFNEFGQAYVALTFDRRGGRIFERVTGDNVHRRMAIVLDNKVYSAPTIQEKIGGGRASITGQFSPEEAHDLAIVLRAGSLPAPVKILQERSVGASLGQQSIDQGIFSMIVGGILVLIFMLVYYGFGGVIVDILLGLNIVLILGVLAGFGATLTLPGIAGMILIIGMAVDASVLIFERIREEMRMGLSPAKAVDEGFSRATLTIVDANVTTVMAAIILYQFGTGPIRGFAVTLSIGVLASMFTAIFVARIFFDLWVQRRLPFGELKL
ncbi:MAG: protein translocase subunit SecD [Desulfohalobiaceae bacterium]|nr:protein translocase subunit SecD [Desulfohalobiaceae bacterium]